MRFKRRLEQLEREQADAELRRIESMTDDELFAAIEQIDAIRRDSPDPRTRARQAHYDRLMQELPRLEAIQAILKLLQMEFVK